MTSTPIMLYTPPHIVEGDLTDIKHPSEFMSGNNFIRKNYLLKEGMECGDHVHNFDHTTVVVKGGVRVKRTLPDGTKLPPKNFTAGDHFLVEAETRHHIIALEDDTVFVCIYSHRNAQGEVVQKFTGWEENDHGAYF